MTGTPVVAAPKASPLKKNQQAKVTAEGPSPSAIANTSVTLKAAPPTPESADASGKGGGGKLVLPSDEPHALAPKLPHERDESINTTGTVASEKMKQAERDVSRGLKDTDRGPEANRTYKKLKQKQA